MADDPEDRALRTDEVAELLQLSEKQVRSMAASGELPARRISSESGARVRYRFSRQAILEWLRGQGGTPPG